MHVMLQSDTAATTFFSFVLVQLLFEGAANGVYFVGKPADSNDD